MSSEGGLKLTENLSHCALVFPLHTGLGVVEAVVPSCVGLPPRGTADVRGVALAFLSAATPQARSFLELRTPARQGEPPFPGAESRSLFRRGSGQVGSSRGLAEVPGARDWMTHTVMSHSSYIRADQAHSNAAQAQICPRRLGGEGGRGRLARRHVLESPNQVGPTRHGCLLTHVPKDNVIITDVVII